MCHNDLIGENHEEILDSNPEERLWLNVESGLESDFTFATHRLRKHDVIKMGRVRFRVREIVSPFYQAENEKNDSIRFCYMVSLREASRNQKQELNENQELDRVLK